MCVLFSLFKRKTRTAHFLPLTAHCVIYINYVSLSTLVKKKIHIKLQVNFLDVLGVELMESVLGL